MREREKREREREESERVVLAKVGRRSLRSINTGSINKSILVIITSKLLHSGERWQTLLA